MNVLPRLLAFGFGNLAMLGWLAVAAAPLVIHLWNRRKYRETSWAAIDFLLAAMRRNARRIQIEHWLLLLIRTAIIVLIVLAVADPYLEQTRSHFLPGQRVHKMIVLDGSFSMALHRDGRTQFEAAKEVADKIVQQSRQGDGFTLVLMSEPARVIVGEPAFDPDSFLAEIAELRQPHTGGDLSAALTKVQELLEQAAENHTDLTRHEVYVLTDLGRTSWVPPHDPQRADARRKQLERLSEMATLNVIDLGRSGASNTAITGVQMVDPIATPTDDVTFLAQVQNFGGRSAERRQAELVVDGERIRSEPIRLEAGGQATVRFHYRFESAGQHIVEIRLDGDSLETDDRRWLSVSVLEQVNVLLVGGKPGSTFFLRRALEPDPDKPSLFHVQQAAESALLERDLDRFECVMLSNVAQFTTGEARVMENYLQQGGGLVFFLGDRVLPDRYNRVLGQDSEEVSRILPARLGPVVTEPRYTFDPLNFRHRLLQAFRGHSMSWLRATPVYRYFRLEPFKVSGAASTALAFGGGDPAIVEEPRHRGRTILVATAASTASVEPDGQRPWTYLPVGGNFVSLVREIALAAVDSAADQYNRRVGEVLESTLPRSALNATVSVATPWGDTIPIANRMAVDQSDWSFPGTSESGVYRVRFSAPLESNLPFAVNVDTAESDPARLEPDELPSPWNVVSRWQGPAQSGVGNGSHQSGLHRWLLYGVFTLLLAESVLAWQFGRGMR